MPMNISKQLFQPFLKRLEIDYQALLNETAGYYNEETAELREFVHRKIRQLELVRVSLAYMEQEAADPFHQHLDLRNTLRQHKLELRFARRRWKRHLVNAEKIRKTQEKKTHVPTFAA